MRISFKFKIASGLLGALLLSASAMAQDFDEIEVRAEQVAGNIYVLFGAGGNIGASIGEDGVILVDDQFAPLTDKILASIAALGGTDLRFIINTHWHGDHTGGNENLGKTGAVIVAHDNVRTRLTIEQVMTAYDGRTVPPAPAGALPVLTFNQEVGFHLNGDEARAIHVRHAHTDGDSMIHFTGANVIHMGDLLNVNFPFIDWSAGGSLDGLIRAAEAALQAGDAATRYIPGHGPVMGRSDVENYLAMLNGVRGRVSALMAEGRSPDEILEVMPVDGYAAPWVAGAGGAERFVRNAVITLDGPVDGN